MSLSHGLILNRLCAGLPKKSVRKLAEELKSLGHAASHRMVAELLQEMGYSLQSNRKVLEGSSYPDRNAQFEYSYCTTKEFQQVNIVRDAFHGEWNYAIQPSALCRVKVIP